MSARKKVSPRFKVGDWVSFQWGTGQALAQIIEDRGPIGVRGRRLYRIQPAIEYIEPFEMPGEEMTAAAPPKKPVKAS